jgi:hypothetical protein
MDMETAINTDAHGAFDYISKTTPDLNRFGLNTVHYCKLVSGNKILKKKVSKKNYDDRDSEGLITSK